MTRTGFSGRVWEAEIKIFKFKMKRIFIFSLVMAITSVLACGKNDHSVLLEQEDLTTGQEDNNNKNKETDMKKNTIKLTINGRSFSATLTENSSTDSLKKHLARGNLNIQMSDYGNMEKVGSLGFSLPRNDKQITTGPGDLILYQGNSFVIYYDTNSWNFTRLGKVDGISTREQMLELLGGAGDVTVTLALE